MLFIIVLAILIFDPSSMVYASRIAFAFVILGTIAMVLAFLSERRGRK